MTGEKKMLLAILQDAVELVIKPRVGWRPAFERREAVEWIQSTDRSWFLSFEVICTELGLEPEWIRAGVFGERQR
jgi:hypothetical protein